LHIKVRANGSDSSREVLPRCAAPWHGNLPVASNEFDLPNVRSIGCRYFINPVDWPGPVPLARGRRRCAAPRVRRLLLANRV